jgi:hypothetical protein
MSIRLLYRKVPTTQPVVTLTGRLDRPRPLTVVAVLGPIGSMPLDATIDSGSDDTVFPEHVAATIGIDLTNAPAGTSTGVSTGSVSVRFAEVVLRIADNHERREWKAWVGFASGGFTRSLLGFAGFLQYFTATFRGDTEDVELAVNSLYPGT